MRVLFSGSASDGHLLPMVPLAQAFAKRGDDVAFATTSRMGRRIEGFDFEVLPTGLDVAELNLRYAPYRARLEQLPFDDRRPYAVAWRFAELDAPAKLDALLAHAKAWRPDLVVHETSDFAAPAVAAAIGVASAHHTFGRGLPPACLERVVVAAAPLWHALGLEADPFAGIFRGTYIDISPPSLEAATPPDGTPIIPLRPGTPRQPPAEWRARLQEERRVVYVTLGTQFNEPQRFALLLEALANVDCTAVMTIGADQDASALQAPANVIVERYIPQGDVLPLAAATLCHGGSGSTLAALAHGLPLVLLPSGADQFDNAGACSRAGTAIELRPPAVTADSVRASLSAVLDDPTYTTAASRVATEIDAMLTPAEAVAILG